MGVKSKTATGILIAFVMTLLLGIYSVLMGAFAFTEAWAGYLFFWFWSSIREFSFQSLKEDIPNSIVGIVLSFLMFWVHGHFSVAVFNVVIMLTLFVILFFSVTKLIPKVIGETTFLYFTVLTGNTMLSQADYRGIAVSYVAGVVFFLATLGLLMKRLNADKKEADK